MLSPPGLGGAGVMTPRKYIKQLQAIAATLNKYLVSLSAGISKALKVRAGWTRRAFDCSTLHLCLVYMFIYIWLRKH